MSLPYLSTAWIEAANELLAAATVEPPVPAPGFTVETVILDPPPGALDGYVITFAGSTMSAAPSGPDVAATVRLTQTYSVAVGVATGELSAQAAFLAADIQVGGDVSVLIAHAGLMARLGDVLAPLRDRTGFGVAAPGDR